MRDTLLRTVEACRNADLLAEKLVYFTNCSHAFPNSELIESDVRPCEECAAGVKYEALSLEKSLPGCCFSRFQSER